MVDLGRKIFMFILIIIADSKATTPMIEFGLDESAQRLSFRSIRIPENAKNFTICSRFKIRHFMEFHNTLFSIIDHGGESVLIGSLTSEDTFSANLTFFRRGSDTVVSHPIAVFDLEHWYHFCFFLVHQPTASKAAIYFDGVIVHELIVNDFHGLTNGSQLVLGQDTMANSNAFARGRSLSGYLAQFSIWKKILEDKVIQDMFECHQEPKGDLVNNDGDWKADNIAITELESQKVLCLSNPLKDKALLGKPGTWFDIRDECNALGGTLPVIHRREDVENVLPKLMDLFKANMNMESLDCSFHGNPTLWLGIHRHTQSGKWVSEYDEANEVEQSMISDKLGGNQAKCVSTMGTNDQLFAVDCQTTQFCAICLLTTNRFYFKGLRPRERIMFDVEYFIFGQRYNQLYFRGRRLSEISGDEFGEGWYVKSYSSSMGIAKTEPEVSPLGRHNWSFYDKGEVSPNVQLTLSQCTEGKFTCRNGECISLNQKCDSHFDCKDLSDESNCKIFNEDQLKTYNGLVPPPSNDIDAKGPAVVFLKIKILSITAIETIDLRFTVNYLLDLRWYDSRLVFEDLKEDDFHNSFKIGTPIWYPVLMEDNGLGAYQSSLDDSTSAKILRETPPFLETVLEGEETYLFHGGNNSIATRKEYYNTFSCHFELHFYPFDTQLCRMNFVALNLDESKLILRGDDYKVKLAGRRELVEYVILDQELITMSNEGNMSVASVQIIFRRRIKYHVTSTFLQTQILITVGYLSFFFRLDKFTDRVMVTLTVLLVVATIMGSIQESLPKASYFKLIDWWLLYCLVTQVMTFSFHTLIGYLHDREEERVITGKKTGKVLPRLVALKAQSVPSGSKWSTRVNTMGKIGVMTFMVGFNIVFWTISIREYIKPASQYFERQIIDY